MNILLTNHQLTHYSGTEVFTYTLAKELKRRGHDVTIYSAYIGYVRTLFDEIGVPLFSDIRKIKDVFDIAHVHHNINAFEVRDRFPTLPMVFMAHGVVPDLEQPPLIDLAISKFLVISEEVKANLINYGIQNDEIEIVRNLIDESIFYPYQAISAIPKRALVLSNYIDSYTEKTIQDACLQLGIEITFAGTRFKTIPNNELPALINQQDLVFSLSRGVMEAMFCARIPIVVDTKVGDGIVTPDNFNKLIRKNFSGRVHWKIFTVEQLVNEIRKYDSEDGALLRELALREFSIKNQTDKLVNIYKEVLTSRNPSLTDEARRMISYVSQSVHNARSITRTKVVNEIGGFRTYDLACKLFKFRTKLIPSSTKGEVLIKSILFHERTPTEESH